MKKEWMERHIENIEKQMIKVELGLLTREEFHAFLELSTKVAYDAGLSDGNDGYVKGHIDGRSDGYADGYSDGYNDCTHDLEESL